MQAAGLRFHSNGGGSAIPKTAKALRASRHEGTRQSQAQAPFRAQRPFRRGGSAPKEARRPGRAVTEASTAGLEEGRTPQAAAPRGGQVPTWALRLAGSSIGGGPIAMGTARAGARFKRKVGSPKSGRARRIGRGRVIPARPDIGAWAVTGTGGKGPTPLGGLAQLRRVSGASRSAVASKTR